MAVLVIADRDGETLRDTTHKTITAALKLSGEVDVLVLGQGSRAAADAAAKI
ncbi:MAG TPA: electron transfer flavoprotein subunit alpha/FixB family protein, partial [Brevundimonas sp.]|nr:electron transfer flavoprotein subunit alpha/FixB family protein [Brevundimonas sp.]